VVLVVGSVLEVALEAVSVMELELAVGWAAVEALEEEGVLVAAQVEEWVSVVGRAAAPELAREVVAGSVSELELELAEAWVAASEPEVARVADLVED